MCLNKLTGWANDWWIYQTTAEENLVANNTMIHKKTEGNSEPCWNLNSNKKFQFDQWLYAVN